MSAEDNPTPETIATLRIDLIDSDPPIWREIEVPVATTLKQLHAVIQAAMAWEDAHLWEFTLGRERIGGSRAARLTLQELLRPRTTKLGYTYDMGDCWEHQLTLTKPRPGDPAVDYPRYLAGENAAPPEDCGGIPGFYTQLEALADPNHPDHEAAGVFGLSRDTIAKMCRFSVPPGYQRTKPPEKPKLGPLTPVIDAILEADRSAPAKQRHTAKRIFERLRAEYGYAGGYTVVKDYVRLKRTRMKEAFVPLAHPPGHAQVDFGQCIGIIGGVRTVMHVFCFDLPHSDAPFVKAYPAETTEAFLDGHVSAFGFFGGVPLSILYDNTKLAVARILGDGQRTRTRAFTELVSHFLFRDRFGRPGKGNDKGKVEGLVKYTQRTFMTPLPHAASFEALNAALAERCRARQGEHAGRHAETIGERLMHDLAALSGVPEGLFEPCEKKPAKVSSTGLARYRMNDYSVPTRFAFQSVLVKGFVDEVVIVAGSEIIARHGRIYGRDQFVFDPKHYLALLEQKPAALDQAAPLQSWTLPEGFQRIRRLLEGRMGNRGKKEFIQILRLMEVFEEAIVAAAVVDAMQLGAIGFDAVKQLVLARIERRPARLDLARYPYLPAAEVKTTAAADYAALLSRSAA